LRRRFFVSRFENQIARLEGDQAHHLSRVLRAEAGQLVELSDGRDLYLARIERVGRGAVEFYLTEKLQTSETRVAIDLLVAIVKFDRFEWALEKATELGASRIVPLAATRSEKALVAAAPKRAARWRKILLESAQQARRLRPPELSLVHTLPEATRGTEGSIRVMLSERPGAPRLREVLQEKGSSAPAALPGYVHISLAVGPEGGWTDAERETVARAGFSEASLGDLILRTETAVIASLAAVHLYFDREPK
jgi:16S rRNA (uracil1498-N3)-methyltransferase